MKQVTSSLAAICLFLASGNLSAETLTRNLTANADWWLPNTWLNPAGTAVSWEDYSDATLNLNGNTLTLNTNATAGKLTFGNQGGTFASSNGAVLTLTDPV